MRSVFSWRIVAFIIYSSLAIIRVSASDEDNGVVEEEEERTGTIIGIDLGTTYSCVGVFQPKSGSVEIIPNDQGNRITPSYVAFTDSDNNQRLVGDSAKNQATLNPTNTIFDVKRFIGRKYSDTSVQSDKKLMPYNIVSRNNDRPYISVDIGDTTSYYALRVSGSNLLKIIMAMHVPQAPGFGSMMKEGARHFSGLEEAVYRNIKACKEFADTVKTAYGPRGMNKMVINHIDKLFVTSDAATIIRELEVEHPAAKMMILSSQMQEQEVGDGTNFVLILAGSLLESAEDLLKMGLTPTEVVEGYELALRKALELLPTLVCSEIKDMQSEAEVKRAIRPSVMSKQYGNEDFITDLVTKACMSIVSDKNTTFNVDNVRVTKILGAGLYSSQVLQGMVFRREAEGNITSMDKTKIAVYTCPVDIASTETKGTVLIKSAQELKDFSRGEENQLEEQIKGIAATGAKVIVAGGKFGDMALHYVNKYNLMAVRLLSKFDLRRLCKTVGATALPRLTPPSPDELGYCDRVYTDELGETGVVVFRQEAAESKIATVVVRGSTDNLMDDIERAIDDGVNNFKALTKDGRLLAGGGACEMELARLVNEYGDTCPGLEQYAIKRFASALEVFPKVLADNAGTKATEVLSRLYAAHQEGKTTAAFNVEGEGADTTLDAVEAGILDPWVTKHWALKYAAAAACTVLKVDQIIMAKRAGGPKPRENKNWDED